VAYFVPDILAAAKTWSTTWGAGPFFVLENIPLDDVRYRGAPSALDHSSAYGQLGDLMIELVQQNDEGPSAFHDLFRPGAQGLHHLATFAPDFEAELARYQMAGFEIATRASARGVPFAFVDTTATHGHMIEVYEDGPGIRGFYRWVAEAAAGWDGENPIRRLGEGSQTELNESRTSS
jgi:hypothetical protein